MAIALPLAVIWLSNGAVPSHLEPDRRAVLRGMSLIGGFVSCAIVLNQLRGAAERVARRRERVEVRRDSGSSGGRGPSPIRS